jgi:MoxR-like ATPase
MLTLNTQIPTAARSAIRALVKAHADWPAFLVEKGITVPANARKSDVIEFALRYPALVTQIEAILANTAPDMDDTPDMPDMPDMPDTVTSDAPMATDAGFTADAVLGPVEQLLAPLVRKELADALAPVIAAANKPAVERVVEIERVVEVGPGEAAARAARPKTRREKRVTFRTLFPSRSTQPWNDKQITLWTGGTAPAVDPFYVVDREQMATLMTAMEHGDNCWVYGPASSGKSTIPMYAAAMTGRNFVRFGMHGHVEVGDLIGGFGIENGATVWKDGALITAMKTPGMVILIDELTLAPQSVQAIFQSVCDDHRTYTIQATGEVVKAADGVVFVASDNTAGGGDDGGLYVGTSVINAALGTRFSRMIQMDYLSPQREAEALANHTKCPLPAARHLADIVAQARRLPALQGVVISLRQMNGFVRMVQDGFTAKQAFATTISGRMPATERAALETLITLAWADNFDALMAGQPAAATPSDSAAARAFPDTF